MLGFGSPQCCGSFTHFEISPAAPPLPHRGSELLGKYCAGSTAKLASGNLKQCKINLQVCEGMGANATDEKGVAPGEGWGGSALAGASLVCCCPGDILWC